MTDTLSTYADLLDALGCPPPAEGRIRVYRGQNQAYPTLTPTALRIVSGEDFVWSLYAKSLSTAGNLNELLAEMKGDSKASGHRTIDGSGYLDAMLLWVRAIKQHYGPGEEDDPKPKRASDCALSAQFDQ